MAGHPAPAAEPLTSSETRDDSTPYANTVFEQPWWLEAVAPGRWREAVVRRDDDAVLARLPYVLRRRFGLTTIEQPPLTQVLGPWLAPTNGKYATRLDTEKKLLGGLVEALPPFDHLRLSLSTHLTNWLPFYWAGFEATVRYTYRLEDLSDLDRLRADFQEHVRRALRKAEKSVEVDHDYPLDGLLRLNAATFARQGLDVPYSDELVRRIDAACAARGARRILGAVDADGRTHAVLFVVWDERTCYPIINGGDPELRSSGANTLLYWEAIRLAAEVSQVFDFEGSMIEPIERFVRAFGGTQTPYFSISKTRLKARPALAARSLLHSADGLRRRLHGLRDRGAAPRPT